jgi:quercetin dioxygenase-like cupin family protein
LEYLPKPRELGIDHSLYFWDGPVSTASVKSGRRKKMKMILILSCLITGVLVAQKSKVAPLMSKDVTGCPGKEVTMITVEYAPGESDVIHRHNAQVFVYVLEGKVVMQVKGGEPLTLGPGQTFYEGPKDIHLVSRNASGTESAKFLVFFMKDKGAPLLIPAK